MKHVKRKRIKLAVAVPFVLGVFIGTMITTFLILAVQSINEELPVQEEIVDKKFIVKPPDHEGGDVQENTKVRKRVISQNIMVSYNVLSSRDMFKRNSFAIHRTWGGENAIQKIIHYYVPYAGKEEMDFAASRKMPVVSLENERIREAAEENRSVVAAKKEDGVFMLWENICSKKLQHYLWFVKVRDDVYLRKSSLEKLLSSLNSSETLFVGNPVSSDGKPREDLGLPDGESYCHEASYVLSWKALESLCPNLKSCQKNARSSNGDVEIARCLRMHSGVNCTAAKEMKELFYSADTFVEQEELQTGNHEFNDKIHRAITLTPLNKPEHLYHLHHYYTKLLLDSNSMSNTQLRAHMIETAVRGVQSDPVKHMSKRQPPSWTKLGVNPPYKSSEKDTIHFQAFDAHHFYTESKHSPSRPISNTEKKDIAQVFKAVVNYHMSHGFFSNKSKISLESGLKRLDPQRGADYIFQIVEKENEGFMSTKFLYSLCELLPVQVTSLKTADYKSTKVNFVVATPSVSRGFQRFIMSFENSFLAKTPPALVGLLIIVYSDGIFRNYDKDLFAVSTLVHLYKKKYPEADLRLVTIKKAYSRMGMIKIASKEYPSYELLFLADIHIDFSVQFLGRCRMNAIENKQVYFPAVFNPYNPSEIYKEKVLSPYATKFQISEGRGSWIQDSFHLACIYNYDLMKIINEKEESNSDWNLVDKLILRGDVRIFRSLEPGLVHMWQDECKEVEPGSLEEKLCLKLETSVLNR